MRRWFGYGRWEAPYWFVGMEPGGQDDSRLYESWAASGGGALIDIKRHEDEWNALVDEPLQTHFFAEKPTIQKTTWQPLIQILFGFIGGEGDAHLYQRDHLGRAVDETALIEMSSVASPNLEGPADRERHRALRVRYLRCALRRNAPRLAVFYGLRYAKYYASIAGGPFDKEGLRWNRKTLCALIPHPSRPTMTYAYWRAYGERLRAVAARECRSLP